MNSLDFTFEQKYWDQGKELVIGIDEVGRGPLAGPVVTAAVLVTPQVVLVNGVQDSKKISKKKHSYLVEQLKDSGIIYSVGIGSVEEINNLGIVGAIRAAIHQSLEKFDNYHHLLMDGLPFKEPLAVSSPIDYVTKGDSKAYSIAAASIIAKDYRDKLMGEIGKEFSQFGWEKNSGYGTKMHCQAIKEYGPTTYHRELFIRNLI